MASSSDLQSFKSKVVSNDGTNGGKLSATLISSGSPNAVWPNVLKAERDDGSTKYRKLFEKFNTNSNEPLSNAQLMMDLPTAGEDWIIMWIGTPTDTQADIVGDERKYGAAYLSQDADAGDAQITVTVEDVTLTTGNDQIFKDGDVIRITTKPNPTSTSGVYEDKTVNGVPSVSGNDVTLVLDSNLSNSYTTEDSARAMSMYEHSSDVKGSGSIAVSSSAGVYDDTTYPPVMNNQGAIDAIFTLTFSDANNFTAVCDDPDVTGLPAGNRNTDYAPTNDDWGQPYFTLEYLGFSGVFEAGDTVTITTVSATIQRWEKRVVPPLCGSLANNKTVSAWNGEGE